MELSKQVCTLDQARKLKNLGVEVKSLFVFIENTALGIEGCQLYYKPRIDSGLIKFLPAFTTAELGAMLGEDKMWVANHENKSEAENRAYNLIERIQLGDIKVHVINDRLNA